jgi:spermidine synthase
MDRKVEDRWVEETLHRGFRVRLTADRVLFDSETEHQRLIIFENADFGRVMMLDQIVQLTTKDEFIYHEMMSHVPLFAHGKARKALIVGGGDGGVLRECLRHPELEQVTLCEIDRGVIDLCRQHFPQVSAGAYDDPRTRIVIADGTRFVAETEDRFDVIMIDSTDPVGPGAVLFTREFYANCRRCLAPGGLLVTQNGLPFLQASELKQSVGFFRELFGDASAYLANTPSYFGGPMSYGWATDNKKLRRHKKRRITKRYEEAGAFPTRYWRPDVHVAAFALPTYVQELVEG